MAVVSQSVAWFAQSELPITWDALTSDGRFGEERLLAKADLVKDRIFGEVKDADEEAAAYNIQLRAYAGKVTAIEIIGAAIDFWMDKSLTITVDSPKEMKTYESRIKALQQQKKDLIAETRRLWVEVEGLLPTPSTSMAGVPGLSSINTELLTPDPATFPVPYAQPLT